MEELKALVLAASSEVGEHMGSHLFRGIKERGYIGSESLFRHVLSDWRTELPLKPGSPTQTACLDLVFLHRYRYVLVSSVTIFVGSCV